MEQIIITHLNGSTLKLQSKANVSKITKCTQQVELLGQDVVDISVESANKLTFLLGDKITVIGRDYTLNTPPTERKISESHFIYDLQFEGVQYDMLRAAYSVNVDTTSNEIQDINGDSLTGDLKRFLDVMISNLNRVFPGKWSLGTYPANTETRTETFSDSDNCLSVLQSLCGEDKYNTEFKISIALNGNRTLNVGATGSTFAYTFEYGKGKGIYELTRQKVSSSNIVTRLNVFGSSKNIMTSKYRAFKLCLPNKNKAQSYIENSTAITKYGVWEGTNNFEDIFPHRESAITALGDNELEFIDNIDGANQMFDLNEKDNNGNTLYLIAGTSAKIHFNTGNLAGYEFEVTKYDHSSRKFNILPITDENGYTFPSPTTEAFQFAVGDKYTITDIYMPQSYIDTAEAKLATAGAEYLAKYSQPLVSYGLTVDSFFLRDIVGMEVESNLLWAGDYLPIKDTDIDVDKTIRVKGFSRDLLRDYSYNLTIADLPITVSTISRIITEINQTDKVIKYNNLNDPARARRNYKAASELITMIDAVQTEAELIGNNPASQFDISGVAIRANYNKNANTIDFSTGTINHNYYPIGNPGTWAISAGNFTSLTPATAYYVYIKASKTAATAVFYLSSTKIGVEDVSGHYHFPLGLLSSVIDGARVFTSTKGYTLITGDSIKTGRISSNDGTHYFDLTTGEFKGDFKFTNGDDVQTSISDAQTAANEAYAYAGDAESAAIAAQNTADNIQVGGKNLYFGTWGTDKSFGVGGVGYCFPIGYKTLAELGLSVGETITISSIVTSLTGGTTYKTILAWSNGTSVIGYDTSAPNVPAGTKSVLTSVIPTGCVSIAFYYSVSTSVTSLSCKKIKLERGNRATDWNSDTDYLMSALTGSTEIAGGLVGTNVILLKTLAGIITGGLSGLSTDNLGAFFGGTYDQAISNLAKIILRKDGSGQLAGGKILWDLAGALNVGNFKIEGGDVVGYADNKDKVRLSTGSLPSLASLIAGQTITASDIYSINDSGQEHNTTNDTIVAYVNKTSYGSITVEPNTPIVLHFPTISSRLENAGEIDSEGLSYSIYRNGSLIGTYLTPQTVNLTAGGEYLIEFNYYLNIILDAYSVCSYFITTTVNGYITYQLTPERSQIAKDGLYSYWSSLLYMYFSQSEGYKYRGKIDIPAGVGGGTVVSNGTTSGGWGKYTPTSSKSSATVTITHNIGDSNYTILIMPTNSITFYLANKGNSTIQVVMSSTGGTFDYILMRTT